MDNFVWLGVINQSTTRIFRPLPSMTYRWDYHTSPYVRMGFWLLLVLGGLTLSWAGRTEVKVYTTGNGNLERADNGDWHFRMRLPETDATKIQLGVAATISWTAFPKAKYGTSQGRVRQMVIAQQQAQAIIVLESPLLKTPHQIQTLQPGLSGSVQIVLARKKALDLLWDWLKGR